MRKVDNGEKRKEKKREEKKRMSFLVATTSLPAVDRPKADRWNAARSRQNSGHYVVCQQSTARTTTAGTPHACAKSALLSKCIYFKVHFELRMHFGQ